MYRDHNLCSFLRSQHGDCHFLLAEEMDTNRLYIAFRKRIQQIFYMVPKNIAAAAAPPAAAAA